MNEVVINRYHKPLICRQCDFRLAPPGWANGEPETVLPMDEQTLAPSSHFAPPMSESEVQQARVSAVPKETQKDTAWCIKVWNEWKEARNISSEEKIPTDICNLSPQQLQHFLSRFVLEVRKKDGMEYPPNTLYHIVCGVMRYLRQNGKSELDLFKEQVYVDF